MTISWLSCATEGWLRAWACCCCCCAVWAAASAGDAALTAAKQVPVHQQILPERVIPLALHAAPVPSCRLFQEWQPVSTMAQIITMTGMSNQTGRGVGDVAKSPIPGPSRALRNARVAQGLSLRALSARAGLPYSTLSKLENGKMALTYDKLIRLAQALNVDLKDIIAAEDEVSAPIAVGRRSVNRAGEEPEAQSDCHAHHYPAAELLGKMMIPIIIDVRARSVEGLGAWCGTRERNISMCSVERWSSIPIFTRRCRSAGGTSVDFDSGMAHAYVRTALRSAPFYLFARERGFGNLPALQVEAGA